MSRCVLKPIITGGASLMQPEFSCAATGNLPEVLYNRRFTMDDGRAKMAFTISPEDAGSS